MVSYSADSKTFFCFETYLNPVINFSNNFKTRWKILFCYLLHILPFAWNYCCDSKIREMLQTSIKNFFQLHLLEYIFWNIKRILQPMCPRKIPFHKLEYIVLCKFVLC